LKVAAATTIGLLAASAWALPARADVLEIGPAGEARWIAGPHRAAAQPAAPIATPWVPDAYAGKVAELSARYDLSPALIEAVVWQESRWQAGAVSPVGARGLAQLMPGTARELGVDADDPLANLEGGARYLRAQIDRFGGDIEKALAAYNAGPGRVESAGGVPAIRETRSYVASIMGRLSDHVRSAQ
jgi:soluble lytic murein transglycosylase-like protein